MKTEKVRFLENVKVRNREGREFRKGEICELPLASAQRWIIRGKAAPVEDGEGEGAGPPEAVEAITAEASSEDKQDQPVKRRAKKDNR